MRTVNLILLSAMLALAGPAAAVEPLSGVFVSVGAGNLGVPAAVGFESAVGTENTWNVSGGLASWGGSDWYSTTASLGGGYKWWVGNYRRGIPSRALQGIFVGPEAKLALASYRYEWTAVEGSPPYNRVKRSDMGSTALFGGGVQAGYQWIFPISLYVAGVADLGYLAGAASVASGGPSIPVGGSYFTVTAKVGYAY